MNAIQYGIPFSATCCRIGGKLFQLAVLRVIFRGNPFHILSLSDIRFHRNCLRKIFRMNRQQTPAPYLRQYPDKNLPPRHPVHKRPDGSVAKERSLPVLITFGLFLKKT